MIDKRLLQLLESNDVEKRKKAVMALAQTKDRDALPHLAHVFKNDGSSEVRDLAKKAGVYINKHAPVQPEPEPEEDLYPEEDVYDYGYDDLYEEEEEEDTGYGIGYEDDYEAEDRLYDDDVYGDVYGDEEEDLEDDLDDDVPLPSEIYVSDSNRETARSYVNSAMDYNVRGDNKKSAETLQRAFRLNPQLMHDSYARTLAATITGLDPDEAIKILGPSADDLRKRSGRGGSSSGSSTLSGIFAILMIVAAGVALAGYFVLPWITLADIPVEGENPVTGAVEQTTFGEQLDSLGEILEGFAELAGDDPAFNALVDAFNGLTIEFNGLNTTLLSIGVLDIYDVTGIRNLVEASSEAGGLGGAGGELDAVETVDPAPLDYTLPLMPIMATVAILLGLVALRSGSITTWLTAAILGLIGLAPLMYFYLDAVNSLLGDEVDLSEFGEATIESGADLLGMGFWLSVGGMLGVVIIPFLAMLTMPSAKE